MKIVYLGFEYSVTRLEPRGRAVTVQSAGEAEAAMASYPIEVVCIGPLAAGTEEGWLTAERAAADSIVVVVSGAGSSLPRYQELADSGQVLFLASSELTFEQLCAIVSAASEAPALQKGRALPRVSARRLLTLMMDLVGSGDLEELERTLGRWNERLLPDSATCLWLVSHPDHVLWSSSAGIPRVLPVCSGLNGWVVATGRSAFSEDLALDPRHSAVADEPDLAESKRVLAVPVFDEGGSVQAVLEIRGSRGRPLSAAETETGEFLAYVLGPVLRAMRLHAEAEVASDPAGLVRPEALEAWRNRFDLGAPLLQSQRKLMRLLLGLVLAGLLSLFVVVVWVLSS